MTLLIDADILVYRCGFGVEAQGIEGVDSLGFATTEAPPLSYALQALRYSIKSICNELDSDDYILILSPNVGNFREEVAVTKKYKGNRKAPRPMHYDGMRQYMIEELGAVVAEDCEGDDLLGIMQTDDTIIVTLDKDLDMIPGWHYNFVNKRKYFVNKTQAYRFFCTQLLVGDSVDNIPGCKNIGKVKAKRILQPEHRTSKDKPNNKAWMLGQVLKAYKDAGHTYEYFVEQAKLIWIMREKGGIFDEYR